MPASQNKPQKQPLTTAPWSAKPGFGAWVLLVLLAMALCFQFVPALVLAVVLSVVCRPLYESLLRRLDRIGFLRRRPSLSHDLASTFTQLLTGCLIAGCVLAPLWVLSKNREEITRCAQDTYADAREWSRGQIQALGVRWDIQEWTDFGDIPIVDTVRILLSVRHVVVTALGDRQDRSFIG